MRNLAAFLSRGGDSEDEEAEERSGYTLLSEAEMAKLWKGLFYCESLLGPGGRRSFASKM